MPMVLSCWRIVNSTALTNVLSTNNRTATVKGVEDARSARTPACRVHTLVNACRGSKKVFAGVRTRHAGGVRALRASSTESVPFGFRLCRVLVVAQGLDRIYASCAARWDK